MIFEVFGSKPKSSFCKIMADLDSMKERFAKLLLGEDMSGGGKGVCTAVTISNAITNLYGNSSIIQQSFWTLSFFFFFYNM